MRKPCLAAAAALLLLSFGGAALSAEPVWKDGVYEAEAEGHTSMVRVAVEIREGRIAEIRLVSHKETPPLVEAAVAKVSKAVIEQNDAAKVPAVSGATFSGLAVTRAVRKALDAARAEPPIQP